MNHLPLRVPSQPFAPKLFSSSTVTSAMLQAFGKRKDTFFSFHTHCDSSLPVQHAYVNPNDPHALAAAIVRMCRSVDLPAEAVEFAEGVRERAASIVDTVDEQERLGEPQLVALRNMYQELRQWFDTAASEDDYGTASSKKKRPLLSGGGISGIKKASWKARRRPTMGTRQRQFSRGKKRSFRRGQPRPGRTASTASSARSSRSSSRRRPLDVIDG